MNTEVDPTVVAQRTSDWNKFMAKLEAAELEFARGRPDDFKSLWSHTDDVTLCGVLGGAVELGWERVAARLTWASSNYVEGSRSRNEISRIVDGDFAYLVQLVQKEIINARMGGRMKCLKQELRVTMVFHHAGDGWRIVHRHADLQTSVSSTS